VTLYDTDFYAWALEQAALLREGAVAGLDLEHLADEIEGLARRDVRTMSRHLRHALLHLLAWRATPEDRTTGHAWRCSSLLECRYGMTEILEDSPTLTQHLPALIARCYPLVCQQAAVDTGLPLATLPEVCPWTPAQILDENFYPSEENA
jgi:hypothetical protein